MSPRAHNPPGRDLNHEQHIQPPQEHRVHAEEVHRQHTIGLGSQELPPGGGRPLGCRIDASALQGGPPRCWPRSGTPAGTARRGCGGSPTSGSPWQPLHQVADLPRQGRPATPMRVGPAAPDEVSMPAQQWAGCTNNPRQVRRGSSRASPASTARSAQSTCGWPPAAAAPRPRGATSAAQCPSLPSSAPAAKATQPPGRRSDRAIARSCTDHRGPVTRGANSQLSTHDRLSGTHRSRRPPSTATTRTSRSVGCSPRDAGPALRARDPLRLFSRTIP